MKRHIAVMSAVLCLALIIICSMLYPLSPTSAQDKNFLADRHAGKGLACSACHKESPPKEKVPMEVCTSCHGDYAKLAERTQKVEPNPHMSHEGNLACESCHHGHKPPENHCQKCHATFSFNLK